MRSAMSDTRAARFLARTRPVARSSLALYPDAALASPRPLILSRIGNH